MLTKVKTWWNDLPLVGKIAFVILAVALMFAISAYNGVKY